METFVVYSSQESDNFASSPYSYTREDFIDSGLQKKGEYQQPFRFLDLPAELRNRVYSYILEAENAIHLPKSNSSPRYGETTQTSQVLNPLPLATCRSVYTEALPILYRNNVFEAKQLWAFKGFLTKIGNGSLGFIQQVVIHVHGKGIKGDLRAIFTKMKEMKLLRKVTIREWKINILRSVFTPEELAKMLGPWIRALHRARQKDTERKAKHVLDAIKLSIAFGRYPFTIDQKDRRRARLAKLETDAKAILMKTLK